MTLRNAIWFHRNDAVRHDVRVNMNDRKLVVVRGRSEVMPSPRTLRFALHNHRPRQHLTTVHHVAYASNEVHGILATVCTSRRRLHLPILAGAHQCVLFRSMFGGNLLLRSLKICGI